VIYMRWILSLSCRLKSTKKAPKPQCFPPKSAVPHHCLTASPSSRRHRLPTPPPPSPTPLAFRSARATAVPYAPSFLAPLFTPHITATMSSSSFEEPPASAVIDVTQAFSPHHGTPRKVKPAVQVRLEGSPRKVATPEQLRERIDKAAQRKHVRVAALSCMPNVGATHTHSLSPTHQCRRPTPRRPIRRVPTSRRPSRVRPPTRRARRRTTRIARRRSSKCRRCTLSCSPSRSATTSSCSVESPSPSPTRSSQLPRVALCKRSHCRRGARCHNRAATSR